MPGDAVASIKIEGAEIGGTVRWVDVEDHERLIDKATVVVDDPDHWHADAMREGPTMVVDLGWSGEHGVLFEGIVTRVVVQISGAVQRVTLTAYDLSYRMMLGGPRTAHYTGTLSSIVQQILTRQSYGIEPGQIAPDPDAQFQDAQPLRQTNLRDWEFIQALAIRYNCRAFTEYNEGSSKFYFLPESRLLQGDPLGTFAYRQDGMGPLVSFRYERLASAAAPLAQATVMDPDSGQIVQQAAAPGGPELPPRPDPETIARLGAASSGYVSALTATAASEVQPGDQRAQAVVAGLPSDPDLAARAAQQDPTRALGFYGEGIARGTIHLRAKGKVTLEGVAGWAGGDWYVQRVNHIVERDPHGLPAYRCRFAVTR